MLAGHERNRLIGALAELRAELGSGEDPGIAELTQPRPRFNGLLDAEDEDLVRELGRSLASLAAATASANPPAVPLSATIILGAVGGSEWVMRRELMQEGGSGRLAGLVPDFVYLITLPYLREAGAKAAAARSRELIEDGGGGS